jgi:hypothetical protein
LGEQMDGRIETDYAAKGLRARISLLVPGSDAENSGFQLEELQKQNAA